MATKKKQVVSAPGAGGGYRERAEAALKKIPGAPAFEAAKEEKAAHLSQHKTFFVQRERLLRRLEKAYERSPDTIVEFFRRFRMPAIPARVAVNQFLSTVTDATVRHVLKSYLRFAERFRVTFYFARRPPHFRLVHRPQAGSKFRAIVKSRHLAPLNVVEDTSFESLFDVERLPLPPKLNAALEQQEQGRIVSCMQVDDDEGRSIMSELEEVLSDPRRIAVVLHNGPVRHIWCLVGEDVRHGDWRNAYAAIESLQARIYKRARAGRKKDVQQLERDVSLTKGSGSIKEKVVADVQTKAKGHPELETAQKVASGQSRVSRAMRLVGGGRHKQRKG